GLGPCPAVGRGLDACDADVRDASQGAPDASPRGTGPAAGGAQPRRKPVGASPTGGRSSRDESPKSSRKRSVVPYSSGLPTTSFWPTTLTSSRSWRVSSVEAHEAPRAASSSPRVIGWW